MCGDVIMFTSLSCDFWGYVDGTMGLRVKVSIKEKNRKQDRDEILTGAPEINWFLRGKYMGRILDNQDVGAASESYHSSRKRSDGENCPEFKPGSQGVKKILCWLTVPTSEGTKQCLQRKWHNIPSKMVLSMDPGKKGSSQYCRIVQIDVNLQRCEVAHHVVLVFDNETDRCTCLITGWQGQPC